MSDKQIVSFEIRMKSLPKLMLLIMLERAEEQLPSVREVMMSVVCRCREAEKVFHTTEEDVQHYLYSHAPCTTLCYLETFKYICF
jgi:hypothetical protein